jgi:two-component system chemotaxis response regulator CheY
MTMGGDNTDAVTVLVADDALVVRKVVAEMLADAGYLVVAEAEDGAEAVALYEQHRPDVVLMDVNMPRLDGISAAAQIKGAHPDARIIVATVYMTEKRLLRMATIGGVEVLPKPFEAGKLVAAIEQAVATPVAAG